MNNFPYDKHFLGQHASFSPIYMTSFYSIPEYPITYKNQLAQYGTNYGLFMYSNRLDKQYQYQQKYNYWNQHFDGTTLSVYGGLFPIDYTTENIYQFKKHTSLIQYPDFNDLVVTRFDRRKVFNHANPLNIRHFNWFNNNVANFNSNRRLPLKIRAIFVPSVSSPVQQLCVGPLSMPSFLFNHMSQPCCSLPLPPPLPQSALTYVANNVQPMFMQGYVNQVYVLPYNLNWQIPQSMVSPYFPMPQQQQQSFISISNLPLYQPSLIRDNVSIFPSPMASSSIINQASPTPQYYNPAQPSICRACVPIPPASNNPVINNSWIQYCAACYQIPSNNSHPNVRRTNGRNTPLLHPSTTLRTINNRSREQYQYPYINTPIRRTPPLPPGAIIIFDEYINKNDLFQEQFNSQTNQKQPRHIHNNNETSIKMPIDDIRVKIPNKHRPFSKIPKTESDVNSHQMSLRSKSIASTRSVYSLSTNDTVNQRKKILNLNNRISNIDDEALPAEVPTRNRHRTNQRRNLPSVHYADHVINVDKQDSISSNSDALRDLRLSLATGDDQIDQLSSIPDNSTKEDEQSDAKTDQSTQVTSTLSQSKRSEIESTATSETMGNTSSITKTNTSETLNTTTTDKNTDTMSITTSTKTDK